jgi:hypothetical protein
MYDASHELPPLLVAFAKSDLLSTNTTGVTASLAVNEMVTLSPATALDGSLLLLWIWSERILGGVWSRGGAVTVTVNELLALLPDVS